MTDAPSLVQRLNDIWRDDDHERGCRGREYDCTCGFDERTYATAKEAAERISVLERALEPFAARAGKLDGKWLDHETQWSPAYGSTAITIGDLRRARTALTGAR